MKGIREENFKIVTSGDRATKKLTKLDFLVLLGCLIVGLGLRFFNLDAKPPASIEIASLGFSLGHGFLAIEIDRLISIKELLAPLQFDPTTTPKDTIRYLMSESTHPPLYFLLNHFWLKLRSPQNELELLHAGRSLSAFFGAAAIPASFGLGYLAFRSRLAGHFAAALMAVSPYGIYISQEARHYTLTVLWIIASLCCLMVAVRYIDNRKSLPIWIVCVWVVVNSLGIATHYFFGLTLCAEAIVIAGFFLKCRDVLWNGGGDICRDKAGFNDVSSSKFTPIRGQARRAIYRTARQGKSERRVSKSEETSDFPASVTSDLTRLVSTWVSGVKIFVTTRILAVAAGTLVGCLVWFPYAKTVSGNEITEWITTSLNIKDFWQPIARMLGWLITMVFLLPVEGVNLAVIIVSAIILLTVLVWVSPVIISAFRLPSEVRCDEAFLSPRKPRTSTPTRLQSQILSLQLLAGFFLAAIALFLIIIYFLRRDLSLAARYHFVYFPAVIVLLGFALSVCWQQIEQVQSTARASIFKGNGRIQPSPTLLTNNTKIVAIFLLGLIGALTVVFNYGFQKSKRADLLVDRIQDTSKVPVIIATTYKTHSEIRELMTVGFEFKRLQNNINYPKFLLAKRNFNNPDRTSPIFNKILKINSRPFDIWTTNLQAKTEDIETLNCQQDSQKIKIKGYRSRLYNCS
ncbi:MAG: glycosyltransferase family 39 protein [Xenococcaceae cyanobacterium]